MKKGCDCCLIFVLFGVCSCLADDALLPTNLPERKWITFQAQGYNVPVTGVIYGNDRPPVAGVPMGGVGTGCIALEATGIWGYRSLFNVSAPFA